MNNSHVWLWTLMHALLISMITNSPSLCLSFSPSLTHTHTHMYTHTNIHTHTHPHTHTFAPPPFPHYLLLPYPIPLVEPVWQEPGCRWLDANADSKTDQQESQDTITTHGTDIVSVHWPRHVRLARLIGFHQVLNVHCNTRETNQRILFTTSTQGSKR